MDNALIIIVLAIVVLAIAGLTQFFRRKPEADVPAQPMSSSPPAAPVSPRLASAADIDAKPFTRWLCDQACAQTGLDLRQDVMALTRLAEAATKAQSEIERKGKAEISLPYISADARGPKHFSLTVTREQLDRLGPRLI